MCPPLVSWHMERQVQRSTASNSHWWHLFGFKPLGRNSLRERKHLFKFTEKVSRTAQVSQVHSNVLNKTCSFIMQGTSFRKWQPKYHFKEKNNKKSMTLHWHMLWAETQQFPQDPKSIWNRKTQSCKFSIAACFNKNARHRTTSMTVLPKQS